MDSKLARKTHNKSLQSTQCRADPVVAYSTGRLSSSVIAHTRFRTLILNFMKYSLLFLGLFLGFLAVVILFISYQNNTDLFNLTMQYMGNIGSFLSGVGTIVIVVITASGLNEWKKQLKYGRYLNMIWDGKVKIKSIENAILIWDVHNFYRPNKDIEKELELKSEINKLMIEAEKISYEVDILNSPDCGVASSILDLQLTFKNVYDHVESYQELSEANDQIYFDKTRKKLREKLNELLSSINNKLNMLEIRYTK